MNDIGMKYALSRFEEVMFTTASGTLVIDKHDFKKIIKEMIKHQQPKKEDEFKRLFQDQG